MFRSPAGHLAMLATLVLAACVPPDKRYDYPAWGFSVVFPEPPQIIDEPATAEHVASFEAKVDREDSQIRQVIVVDTAPDETLESITRDHAGRDAAAMGGDAAVPTAVTTADGVVGREVRLSHDGQPIFIARYFLVGRRLYEVNASAVSGFDDPFVTGFLNSLRITAAASAATHAP
jgi:hypothetical protein